MIRGNHRLATNAFLNCLRVCANIVLPLISFPYLTRTLHASNFGKVAFCSSIVSYFTLLAELGISNYSIREGARIREKKKSLSSFSNEIFSIHLISAFLTYLTLALFLLIWNKELDYKIIIATLSVSIISTAFSFAWLPNVLEDFWFITVRVLALQSLSVVAIFIFVKDENDFYIYTLITALTSALSGVLNYLYARRKIRISFFFSFDWKKHIKPILILFANTLMITIYLQSDITMIGIFKGDTDVGLYKTSVQIYSAIKTMLNAITVVAIPRLSFYLNENDKDGYNRLSTNIIWSIGYLCIPAMIGLFLIAKNCILLVGGTEYISSTPALKILCFALIAAVFGNFFVNAVLIVNRLEKKAFIATVISAFVNIVLNLFFIPMWGFVGAAITTLIAEIVVVCLLILFSKDFVKITILKNNLIPMCIGSALIIVSSLFIDRLNLGLALDTISKIILSGVLYTIISLIFLKNGRLKLFK